MKPNHPIKDSRPSVCESMIQSAVLLCTLLCSSLAFSADISGIWKHSKKPVWIEIRLDKGDGIVNRNDKFPDRVGSIFIKNIKADESEPNLWHGTAYILKLESYKDVEISLSETGKMLLTGRMGFFSHTVEWLPTDNSDTLTSAKQVDK
jgi:hypothetical protein